MPSIDPIFGHARTKKPGKGKRRVMRSFKLDEISVVDNPAQAGATVKIMKRRTPLHEMHVDYGRAFADVAAYRKLGMHKRASQLEGALTLHANTTIQKTGVTVMDLFSKAGAAPATADEAGMEEMLAELRRQLPNEDPAELRAMLMLAETLGKEGEGDEEEYLVEDDDAEEEDDIDADDLEEIEADDLEGEIIQTRASTDMNDERQLFDEDQGEVAATANKLMRDPRMSKRRAFLMAGARAIAKRGGYNVAFTKASSTITTDSHAPFQQQRAPQRRAEMDRRTVQTRHKQIAELEAMRAGFGRENEKRRRTVDNMVLKLREGDRYMTHRAALQKIRGQYPELFR